ncbi:hypothetical protein [Photobacterium indicum]|nr:hypothetical protein [Photobacterium indicum]
MQTAHKVARHYKKLDPAGNYKVFLSDGLRLAHKEAAEAKAEAARLCPLRSGRLVGYVTVTGSPVVHDVYTNDKVFAVGDSDYDQLVELGKLENIGLWMEQNSRGMISASQRI